MLQKFSDQELLVNLKNIVGKERLIMADVLRHLREVDSRRLYLSRGHASLFAFCVEYLGYEESQAQRRISACRLLKEIPELEKQVENGALSLTALTQAQSFFRQEAVSNKPMTISEKKEVLTQLENKTTREVEKKLITLSPSFTSKKVVTTRPVSESKAELKVIIDNETLAKLNKLKDILAQKNLNNKKPVSLVTVLELLATEGLEKHDPMQKAERAARRGSKSPSAQKESGQVSDQGIKEPYQTRYLPVKVRHQVWRRDGGTCGFVDPLTGKICQSQYRLQLDHIVPFATGGENSESNLRLRCANHNIWHAIQSFGPQKMGIYLKS